MFNPAQTFIAWGLQTPPIVEHLSSEDTTAFWERIGLAHSHDGYAQAHAMTFGRGMFYAVPCTPDAMRSLLDYSGAFHRELHAAARVVLAMGVRGLFRPADGGETVIPEPVAPRTPGPAGAARQLIFNTA